MSSTLRDCLSCASLLETIARRQSCISSTVNSGRQLVPCNHHCPWKDQSANFAALASAPLRKKDCTLFLLVDVGNCTCVPPARSGTRNLPPARGTGRYKRVLYYFEGPHRRRLTTGHGLAVK